MGRFGLSFPIQYAISNRLLAPQVPPEEYLRLLFQTSADLIQLREKDLEVSALQRLATHGAGLARQSKKLFLLNSNVELAQEVGASGVHLTSRQDARSVMKLIEPELRRDFLVGQSTHSLKEAFEAEASGVDYVLFGPVFSPVSKASHLRPVGLGGLTEVCRKIGIPVIALGGITSSNQVEILNAGASGFAGISWPLMEIEGFSEEENAL